MRLREAMEQQGLDPENHVFECEAIDLVNTTTEEEDNSDNRRIENTLPVSSGNIDLSQLMIMLMEMNEKMEQSLVKSDQTNQKMDQNMAKLEQTNEEIRKSIAEGQVKMDEKFSELHGKVGQVQTEVREVQTEVREVQSEVREVEHKLNSEVQRLENLINVQTQDGVHVREVHQIQSIKIKPPTFDGLTSFGVFRFQFETAARQNNWDGPNRVAALIVSLKGGAAETLQTIPDAARNNFEDIMQALDRKYGSDHKTELYRLELKGRCQRLGESLQEFGAEVERLAHLAFSNMSAEYVERMKVDAFVDGIRDVDTRRATFLQPKKTFAETVACALTVETAQTLIRPSMKVRRVDIHTENNTEQMAMRYRDGGRRQIRCWTCDKVGHISQDCRERRKRGRSPSPILPHSRKTDQLLAKEDQGRELLNSYESKGQKLAHTTDCSITSIQISRLARDGDSLSIKGMVDGKNCNITLDTGATRSIVRGDLIDGAVKLVERMKLQTVTGESANIKGRKTVHIKIRNNDFQHEVLVADIVDEVILGMDFMKANGFVLDVGRGILYYDNVGMQLQGSETAASVGRVIIDHREKLPPSSETVVWGTLEGGSGSPRLWVVEANKQGEGVKEVIIGKTLVTPGINNKVPIRVLNLSNRTKTIKKGTVLGKCEEISTFVNCEQKNPASTVDCQGQKRIVEELIQKWTVNLPLEQKMSARKLLERYSSIFCTTSSNNGRTTLRKHRIDTGNELPIRQAPRRLPLAKQQEVDRMITEMQTAGVIEPSSSPWSSPVVLVEKKDGSLRFCVDYRKLNAVTKKDSYPLPRIDDTLDTLSGAKVFSTLDLQSGYWQVEVQEEDREKTAFSVGNGLWQFNVMPFGLCNAPATFERLMECVLKGLHWRTCLVYLDDIIVIGKTFENHLKNLEEVFERIQSAGLKLSPKKCTLFRSEVKYLGHKVTIDGIHTDEDKISAVKNWPRPKNLHELRSFLGLCTYYRRFVPGFADVAKSLHDLTRKNYPFEWNEKQEKSFIELRKRLCSAPILAYPIPNRKFILDTDASNNGIGGVLSQEIDGSERVIAYYSKVLSKPEKNYCVTRRELLAIVECVKHFHKYLYGQKFHIRTDHGALQWLLQFKNPEGQVARWIERLQAYDYEIEHRRGSVHGNADALSRRPCSIDCKHCERAELKEGIIDIRLTQVLYDAEWTDDALKEDQLFDPDLSIIMQHLEKGQQPTWQEIADKSPTVKAYWAQWKSLKLIDGCLKRVWESTDGQTKQLLNVVPKKRINQILEEYHGGTSGGHLGINKTLSRIRQRFYWSGCRQDVVRWCEKCDQCGAVKGPVRRSRGAMKQYNVGAPFERIAMDIVGPFPITNHGNKYGLVIMDYFSKWPEVYPIRNQETTTIVDALVSNWISRYGVPMEIHTDQGRNFESNIFQEVCKVLGINKTRTTPLHPQSDGMVERFNGTLEEYLAKVVDKKQKDWDQHIPLFLMAYRSAVHDTTGVTPAKTIFGNNLRLPGDVKFGVLPSSTMNGPEYVDRMKEQLESIHRFVRDKIQISSDRMKARYDIRANSTGFEEGQLVWLYNPQRKKGVSPKLQPQWEGPYTINTKINDVIYRIKKGQ